jgi:hypothetical protein
MQRREQGAETHLKCTIGHLPDSPADDDAVMGFQGNGFEDEQIKGPAQRYACN